MKAPLTLTAHLANGTVVERTYHVGGIARMVANIERIALDFDASPILTVEIAPYIPTSGRE